jgi:ADP-ribosyl-[dinitrogen reductase] hydrolase
MTDKKRGMFYGLAIGDALGAAVEFREKDTFPLVTGYRGFGPHGLEAGQWTDDTSMALALADSIAHGWSKKDQLERYLQWRQNGKYSVTGELFDIGNTTRHAIDNFERTGDLTADDDIAASGNGSIMRLAPVVIKYYPDVQLNLLNCLELHTSADKMLEFITKVRESSETTHASPLCVDSCIYMAVVSAALLLGEDREKVLSRDWWILQGIGLHNRVHDIVGNNDKEPVGSGFVVDSLHAALWAFKTSFSFEEAVLKAVNLGDDSDTTGAVCGQFAGAYWGYSGIPGHLIDGLDKKEIIDLYLNPILG